MTRRGQVVLLAAVALAVALVPLALAYLQLGYHADLGAAAVDEHPARDADRMLSVAVDDAVDGIAQTYRWSDRRAAVTTVRERLASDLSAINRSILGAGAVGAVTYNDSRAAEWAAADCPGGPDRQFGSCLVDRGLVVQERDGYTHVVAAAFDVRAAAPAAAWRLTLVVPVDRPR